MDEITNTGETKVVEQKDGNITEFELKPEDFSIARVTPKELAMPDKETAIRTGQAILKGKAPGPHEDLVLLNAGATIYLGGKAGSIAEGVEAARETLRSGAAQQVVERVAAYTQRKKRPAA